MMNHVSVNPSSNGSEIGKYDSEIENYDFDEEVRSIATDNSSVNNEDILRNVGENGGKGPSIQKLKTIEMGESILSAGTNVSRGVFGRDHSSTSRGHTSGSRGTGGGKVSFGVKGAGGFGEENININEAEVINNKINFVKKKF